MVRMMRTVIKAYIFSPNSIQKSEDNHKTLNEARLTQISQWADPNGYLQVNEFCTGRSGCTLWQYTL